MKLDVKPPYSWWAESHNNTPKHSIWLQTALNELDEKTKAMLALIEEEADSFAQRVEMYYKKRPELIGLIEQFYRAYRSLASRYDILKAKVKLQEIAAAQAHVQQQQQQQQQDQSQSQPQPQLPPLPPLPRPIPITPEALMETPFGKPVFAEDDNVNMRGVTKLVKKYDTCDSASDSSSDVEDPEPEAKNGNSALSEQDSEVTSVCSSSLSDAESESVESKMKVMESVISNLERDNLMLLRQLNMKNHQTKLLRDEVNKLKKEKSFWKDECHVQSRKKTLLEKQLEMFRTEYSKVCNSRDLKFQSLQDKIDGLQKENNKLTKKGIIMSWVLIHLSKQTEDLDRRLMEERTLLCEEKKNMEEMLESEKQRVSSHINKLEDLEKEIYRLCQENKERGAELLQRNEEKIEAIRQLSMAMESLRVENKMLEEALRGVRTNSLTNRNSKKGNLVWRIFSFSG